MKVIALSSTLLSKLLLLGVFLSFLSGALLASANHGSFDINLIGDKGTELTSRDFQSTLGLFLFVDSNSFGIAIENEHFQDHQSKNFKVILMSEDWAAIQKLKKKHRVSTEIFRDINGVLRAQESPTCSIYSSSLGQIALPNGIPSLQQVQAWAVRGLDSLDGVFYLGRDRVFFQQRQNDCGAAAAAMLVQRLRLPLGADEVYMSLDPGPEGDELSLMSIKKFFAGKGIQSSGWRGSLEDVRNEPRPVILHFDNRHFVVLVASSETGFLILDPSLGRQLLPLDQMRNRWRGVYFRVDF